MKKRSKKFLSGFAGAAMMLSGCAVHGPAPAADPAASGTAVDSDVSADSQNTASLEVGDYTLTALDAAEIAYQAVADVEGDFSFDQNVISPSDDVFNLFGTALTGACAKPAFAFEEGYEEAGKYYINVSGSLRQSYQVTLSDLKDQEETRIMSCACATGSSAVNAEVGGIPLSAILQLADLEEGANTITFKGTDGYGVPMPLSYALDKEAMIVYRINGQELPENQRTQLWMPGSVAKYFTRNIVDIEITAEEAAPEVIEADDEYRAQVSIMNYADEEAFPAGQAIVFEGYADDYDKAISAVQVSMDGGQTWTTYETQGATADKWVYWYFTYTPETAGTYKLMVRAVNEDGAVTPLASTLIFQVEDSGQV